MKFIAHRGLVNGPDVNLENRPEQINAAIEQGFDVEVDVWYVDSKIRLGHDGPDYCVDLSFLKRKQVWAHAKNPQALEYLLNNNVHCFWHDSDERTLTSQGYIWTYPNKETFTKSVIVVLEKELTLVNKNIFGVCGDYVATWSTTSNSNLL
jgi:alpha-glucosidase (family GH31 glycosyl hydrolase)